MQPCQVCGGMAINPNGYCTQCGTFRGQVAQPVSGGTPYPQQQGGYQYPTPLPPSGAPYQGQVSGTPYPFSGPPISGGPGYQPQPPRRSFTGPLIASSAILIVLIAAIIVVAIVRSPSHNGAGGGGTPTPTVSGGPSASIDTCLVGTWKNTSDRQTLDIPGVGPVTFVGSDLVTHIHEDGTVEEDYATAKPYTAEYSGHKMEIVITGTSKYRITTASNTITFHDMHANEIGTVKLDGAPQGTPETLTPDTDPVQYTCATNTATENTAQYDVTMTRTSKTP